MICGLALARPAPGRRGRLLRAFGVTFGDLVDNFYVNAFLDIGAGNFDIGLPGGGLRGGRFAVTEPAFRLELRLSGAPARAALGGLVR